MLHSNSLHFISEEILQSSAAFYFLVVHKRFRHATSFHNECAAYLMQEGIQIEKQLSDVKLNLQTQAP